MVNRRAFSLLEMTVVTTILLIVAAVTLPSFVSLNRGQSSRDFQSALLDLASEARLLAIESGRNVEVTYQDDRRAFVVSSTDPTNFESSEERTVPLVAGAELTSFTVSGLYATAGDWMIEFYPDGTGNGAGIEIEENGSVYSVRYNGEDGSSVRSEGRLEELSNQEWQAGEIERRI